MNINSNDPQSSPLDQVESWLETARQRGYQIRYDHFGGSGGGVCEFNGQKWVILDAASSAIEQLEILERAIAKDDSGGDKA